MKARCSTTRATGLRSIWMKHFIAVFLHNPSFPFQWQICNRCSKPSRTCNETQSWHRWKRNIHQLSEDWFWYWVSFLTDSEINETNVNCRLCSWQAKRGEEIGEESEKPHYPLQSSRHSLNRQQSRLCHLNFSDNCCIWPVKHKFIVFFSWTIMSRGGGGEAQWG